MGPGPSITVILLLSLVSTEEVVIVASVFMVLMTLLALTLAKDAVRILFGGTERSMQRVWRVTKWATLFLGFVGWLALTFAATRPPLRHSNEYAAMTNLRTINTAEVTYLSSSGGTYGTLSDLIAARLLEEAFNATKAGYRYSIAVDAAGYTATALPVSMNTGKYGYYSGIDAVIRYAGKASGTCMPCFPKGMADKPVPYP